MDNQSELVQVMAWHQTITIANDGLVLRHHVTPLDLGEVLRESVLSIL